MKKAVPIIIGVLDILLLGVIVVSAVSGWRIGSPTVSPSSKGSKVTQTTAASKKKSSSAVMSDTQSETVEPITDTEPDTTLPEESESSTSKFDSLGEPEEDEFLWVSEEDQGDSASDNRFLSNSEIVGSWKAEIFLDNINEFVYVTINEDASITVEPYKINKGSGWQDESSNEAFTIKGSFEVSSISASNDSTEIKLFKFYESGSNFYGYGTYQTGSGEQGVIGLIRPNSST